MFRTLTIIAALATLGVGTVASATSPVAPIDTGRTAAHAIKRCAGAPQGAVCADAVSGESGARHGQMLADVSSRVLAVTRSDETRNA